MNARELALALAATTVVADAAKDRKDFLRAELLRALDEVGADAAVAALPNGERIAKSSIVAPSRRVVVTDEEALTKHVNTSRPDEIVLRIRESYRKVLLDSLVEGPEGTAVDPSTGEVIPGVKFAPAAAYVTTRFEKDGRDVLEQAIREGVVSFTLEPVGRKELEA